MMGEAQHGDVAEADLEATAPVWPVFADLMSGLVGALVLILLCVLGAQYELSSRLDREVQQRQLEAQRRQAWSRPWPARWPPGG
jgi:hypothetical protein